MRDYLVHYLDLLFGNGSHCQDIKQEISQNTLERYDDLIAQGKSPEVAYKQAIDSIGNINDLIKDPNGELIPLSRQVPAPTDPTMEIPADGITQLALDWTKGSITLLTTDGNTILLSAPAETLREIEIDCGRTSLQLENCIDGEVTVYLPKDLSLKKVEISTTSAQVSAAAISAQSLTLDASGGAAHFEGCRFRDFEIDTSTMDITLLNVAAENAELDTSGSTAVLSACQFRQLAIDTASTELTVHNTTAEKTVLDTASGTAAFALCRFGRLEIDTASWDVGFSGSVEALVFDSVSASFTGVLTAPPKSIAADTTSGSLNLALPKESGIALTLDTCSGDLISDFHMQYRSGKFVCGNGECQIEMNSTSGGIKLKQI